MNMFLGPDEKVMFKLTLPEQPNLYHKLARHPNCVRVVALSGGYSREDSCKMLRQNRKMIASFSRAFAEGLSVTQTEEEFTATLDKSCELISKASEDNMGFVSGALDGG